MQPATFPAVADDALPPPRRSVWSVLSEIIVMAIPFAAGAIIVSGLHLGKVAVLARAPQAEPLELQSMLQPAFLLVLALMEGLAISNQVFSARSKNNWPRSAIFPASWRMSAYAVAGLSLFAAIAYVAALYVPVEDALFRRTLDYLPLYILSLSAFVVFDIFYAAMRGQGKLARSLLPFLGLALIDLSTTYVLLVAYDMGFDAVLIGNLAGPLAMLPVMVLLLKHEAGAAVTHLKEQVKARTTQLLMFVGTPIALTILVSSLSAAVIFPVLADFGSEYASAFLVVMRLRVSFMIPAIAIGSVIAILVNQLSENSNPTTRLQYLGIGVPVMLGFYGLLTALLPFWDNHMINLLVSPSQNTSELRAATDLVMQGLQLTFFFVSGAAMLQVVMEQLGRATQVLVIAIVTEIITGAAVFYAQYVGHDLDMAILLLSVISGLTFALFLVQFGFLLRQQGRHDAV
ncbi:MATE family efflux transporter [Phaeobacter gallaeciensis]|uniref:Uncharacterized protein n=1 Tax=Phaeobacter gallaeciensis TaxID=60890 RepID=A0AAC9Z995_9RHOB|nr:hypothetical protein [Phaeobacter gallaeciensis]AHD09788.1 hypothetical protein Gal_02038 [Phaeobacter gallaeciensis DSM 26640]ATE93052.1 hypothetical protein PhaeoP11_02029 [Phaeobacter gallaeciensis]ATE97126.1 hypothetical protein PhaeoP73_01817 [Phaeobacter gallaeciensis]ATF01717.1 hypothetical protein PhaeoP75_02079 [Phaeobacter gallaeciensis]ATF06097.1 hypothetical protein PhaeoP63_02028 [Phaeobacter gallaeciensis]